MTIAFSTAAGGGCKLVVTNGLDPDQDCHSVATSIFIYERVNTFEKSHCPDSTVLSLRLNWNKLEMFSLL